jgi:hypothetical protein
MTYTLDRRRLFDQPGDEDRSLAQTLGPLPGVTIGPNGQIHVAISGGALTPPGFCG